MYNAIKITALAAGLMLAAASCSKDNTRATEAEAILEQVKQYKDTRDYAAALDRLDTLDIKYRDCIAQRKSGTRLRIETLLCLTIDSIDNDEARRVPLQQSVDSLAPLFLTVSMPGTEGYRVLKSTFKGSEMARTSVQPRIDDKGYFFVVVNLQGRKIGLNGLSLGDVTAAGQSFAMEGSEMMSLSQEEVTSLAEAISQLPAKPITMTLTGAKDKAKVNLTADDVKTWQTTWRYTKLSQMLQTANIRREKYEYQLDKLRSQLDSIPQEAE